MSSERPIKRVSLKRVIRQIEHHKAKIREHRDALVRLRVDLERVDAYVEGAHQHLQDAINDLCEVQ